MKFYSLKYKELILTVDPKTVVVESGVRSTKGELGLYPHGLSIEFKSNEFDTSTMRMNEQQERRLIQILKKHPSYGSSFIAEDHNPDADHENIEIQKQIEEDKKIAAQKAADTNKEPKSAAKK